MLKEEKTNRKLKKKKKSGVKFKNMYICYIHLPKDFIIFLQRGIIESLYYTQYLSFAYRNELYIPIKNSMYDLLFILLIKQKITACDKIYHISTIYLIYLYICIYVIYIYTYTHTLINFI